MVHVARGVILVAVLALGPAALVFQPLPAAAGRLKYACVPNPFLSRAYPLDEEGAGARVTSRSRGGYGKLEDPEIAV